MKRIFILLFYLVLLLPIEAQDRLSSAEKTLVLEKVEEYCKLLKTFSADIEQINLMDSISACCENDRVQTYNDLLDSAAEKAANLYSVPLFQYLQDVTFLYENELEITFSDIKCENRVDEPITSSDIKSYATVHVRKTIKGNGINKDVNELIKINLDDYKISGTIHEDFKNPEYLFLKALEQYQAGKADKALEMFKECANSSIYAGRYRAMTMIGRIYIEKRNWANATEWLTKASEQDPSASLLLALIYTGKVIIGTTPVDVPLHVQNKTLGLELFARNVDNVDADYPEIAFQSMVTLGGIYIEGKVVPRNEKKFLEILNKLYTSFQQTKLSFLSSYMAVVMFSIYSSMNEDFQSAYKVLDMIQRETIALNPESSNRKQILAQIERHKELLQKAINNVDVSVSQDFALVNELVNKKEYVKAISEYKKLADKGDVNACKIMYMYYFPMVGEPQNDFDKFLYSQQEKNKKKALSYLLIAAEKGDASSCQILGVCLVVDDELRDLDESIKWTLRYEDNNVFKRNQSLEFLFYGFVKDRPEFKTAFVEKLKKYTSVSGAANFMLSSFYKDNDRDLYNKYIEDGCQFGYFPCLYAKAEDCLKANDLTSAEQTTKKLIERGYPSGYFFKGKIEEVQSKFKEAYEDYMIAYDKNDHEAAIALARMYHDGKYVDKNLDKAKEFIQQGIMWAREFFDNPEAENAEKLLAEWLGETTNAQEYNAPANGQDVDEADILIVKNLERLTDTALEIEKKVELSESLTSLLFESKNSVVKTLSTNGSTVVATQKVEDFMLQLISYSKQMSIVVVDKEIGADGKLKSLSVMLK